MNDSHPPPSFDNKKQVNPDENQPKKDEEPNPYRDSKEAMKHFRRQLHLLDESEDPDEDGSEEPAGKEKDDALNNARDATLTEDVGATETLAPSMDTKVNIILIMIFINLSL